LIDFTKRLRLEISTNFPTAAITLNLSGTTLGSVQKQSVLHIGKFYRPHLGGIETHVEALCQGLRKSMDVRVLVASNRRYRENSVIDGIPVTRVHVPVTIAGAPICPGMVGTFARTAPTSSIFISQIPLVSWQCWLADTGDESSSPGTAT